MPSSLQVFQSTPSSGLEGVAVDHPFSFSTKAEIWNSMFSKQNLRAYVRLVLMAGLREFNLPVLRGAKYQN